MGIRERIKASLISYWEKKYEQALTAAKMTYGEWLEEQAAERMGYSGKADVCRDRESRDSFRLLTFGEGRPAEGAMEWISSWFEMHPECLIVYGDEDRWEEACRQLTDPVFRPDWSPDTFLSQGHLGSLVAVREDWYAGLAPEQQELYAMLQLAGGWKKDCRAIGHIPRILFHKEAERIDSPEAAKQEGRQTDTVPAGIEQNEAEGVLLSVIIPSKDHPVILKKCLEALQEHRGRLACEVIVVDNGSSPENRREIAAYLEQMSVPVTYLYEPMEFHFSRMCNLGAGRAGGKLLLFLNDDVELRCPGCLERMAHKALQSHVGAVGMKLYYPDSVRIQHAGIVNLPMGPVHKLQFLEDNQSYYDDYNVLDRNVLAVTGACLMVTSEKYTAAGGMREELPVAFNDVDLCFTLWEQGHHNVVLNSVYAWHHESLSRGEDEAPEKLQRLLREKKKLYDRHTGLTGGVDPYYSRSLNRDGLDTRIRPAYVTGKNRPQRPAWRTRQIHTAQYRRDNCLLLRIERCEAACIQGYSVVLGDNNACYDKALLLWRLEASRFPEPEGELSCSCVQLEGQYRPELTENMTDQKNVGLCGFHLELPEGSLAAGRYRLGITAVSRVGGTRLINWSSHVLQID